MNENENEDENIFLNSIYTKEKLNKYKKILNYFKNHIKKVVDAIEKDVINHSILKTLIDSIEKYYKEYNINIDSIEDDDSSNEEENDETENNNNESEDDEENNDTVDDEENNNDSEDNEDNDNKSENDEEHNNTEDQEDSNSKDKLLEDTSSSINLNNDSEDSDSDSSEDSKNSSSNEKKDILLKPFFEGELIFKKNNKSDIYQNIKTFISNSYVY